MWNEDLSSVFLQYGKYFIPQRDFQFQTIAQLIPDPGRPFTVLELCCGDGLLAGKVLKTFPACRVLGLDGSSAMLEAAQKNLGLYGERFQAGLFDLPSSGWRKPAFPVHAVLSSMAVHHLDALEKQQLFDDMAAILSPGGVLILSDVVLPEGESAAAYAADALEQVIENQALALDGTLGALDFFRREQWNMFRYPDDPMDKPSPLFDQLQWLKNSGFCHVDVYWMLAGHVVFGGMKPGN